MPVTNWPPALIALIAALATTAHAGPDSNPNSNAPTGQSLATPPWIVLQSDTTVAEVGRTRVIAFTLDRQVGIPPVFDVTASPDTVLEILAAPPVLPSSQIGYVRVRGLAAGQATLTIGNTSFRVDVVPPRVDQSEADPPPTIVGPSPGAWVWGVVSVGVERRVEPGMPEGHLRLALPDGREIDPVRVSDASLGPDRRAVFEIDTATLPPGPVVLTPIATFDDLPSGTRRVAGSPVVVVVTRPEGPSLTSAEAEARFDVERPRRFQEARTTVGQDPAASGGAYFNNFGSYPAVCFPVKVEQAGYHQVIVRAMGTLAGGELPWIDVVVDGADAPVTGGPLVSMRWHRLAVGTPIWLEPGTRVITPFFANDFYVEGAADRNLLLDTIEVARVGPPVEPPTSDVAVGDTGLVIPSLDRPTGDGSPSGGSMGGSMGAGMSGSMGGAMMPAMGAMPAGAMSAGAMGGAMMAPPVSVAPSMMSPAMLGAAGMGAGVAGQTALGARPAYDPMGVAAVPVRVALDRVLDGLSLTGDLLVEGQAWTPQLPGQNATAVAPDVAILVNGREVARQRTFAPRFLLDAREFRPGDNTLQLVASSQGFEARSPVQTMRFDSPGDAASPTSPATPRRTVRIGIHDPAWDDHSRTLHRSEHYPRERAAVGMYSRETARVRLPDNLAGRFHIGVEALGSNFEGDAQVTLALETPGQDATPLGTIDCHTWWDTRFVEPADVPAGPKTLLVTFSNDHYRAGAGYRNVWLQSVVLREGDPVGADQTSPPAVAPVAALLYPRDGYEFFMHASIIAAAADDRGVERIELVIDGVETGIRRWVRLQPGPFALPLPARTLDPGTHTVSVRAYDEHGNVGESSPATITILATEPAQPTRYDRAITLLDRFAFGPDDRELAAILTMGEGQWLRDRLARPLAQPGEITAMAPGLIWFEDGRYDYGPPRRALEHAFYTPNPARARFVLWARNHFSTWIRKAEGDRTWQEHAEFSRLGPAPFADLLLASATSPAMLRYLDQDQSFAGRLNENYAREIMELHTLGVDGGYTQQDVTNLAGLLTGWTSSTLGSGQADSAPRAFRFRFDPQVSSGAATTVVGLEFPQTPREDRYDRARFAIEALAAHPSTARYVCTKLCEAYVSVPPPPALVDDLALEFARTGGDMAHVLVAMSQHPDFWAAARDRRLATPLDFALRLSRGASYHHPWRLSEFLQLAGFQVFDRSTPDGYPTEDSAYGDSNAMIQRWSLAQDASWAMANLVPDTLQWGGAPTDRAWAQKVIDCLAIGLTGRVLGERSNAAAIDLLLSSTGEPNERVRMIAPVIAQMPEANLK